MPLGERSINEVLTALASNAPSPGSGAAAAVALAFAAACAGKAVAISVKHGAGMQGMHERLAELASKSLQRADADARYFEEFLHNKNSRTADKLLQADAASQNVAQELGAVLDEIEPHVHKVMVGDMIAARALLEAANIIEARIAKENERASDKLR